MFALTPPHCARISVLFSVSLYFVAAFTEEPALFQSAHAGVAGERSATAISLVGKVTHLLPDTTTWQRTGLGTRLPAGTQIKTGRRSLVELRLPDGTTYRLGPMSVARLETFTPNLAKLDQGGLFARVIQGSLVRLTGVYGTVSVRGTDVAIEILNGVEYVRVWDGPAEYTTPQGTVTLAPGTATQSAPGRPPAPPVPTAPGQFSAGQETPWWEQISPGVQLDAMADAPPTQVAKSALAPVSQQVAESQPTRQETATGSLEVIVESAPSSLAGISGAGLPSLATIGLAVPAARGMASAFEPMLGKRVFGPYPEAMAFGLVGEAGSVGVGRVGARFALGNTYFRISGAKWAASHTDSDLLLDETYVRAKNDHWSLLAGRFRLLDTPVDNSDYGTLTTFGLSDGVRVDFGWRRWQLTAAWLDNYDSLAVSDREAWYFRAKAYLFGGSLALAALRQDHAGTGIAGQFSLPLVADYVDFYGEIGDDPTGRHLETFGLYFPELFQATGLDLYLERARRSGGGTLSSMHAYWRIDDDKTAVGIVEHSRKHGWRLGVGLLFTLEGLR